MNKIQHLEELTEVLKKYNISKDDICIVGSSVLSYYGLRINKDIDIIIKKNSRTKKFGNLNTFNISNNIECVKFHWLPHPEISDDVIIENSSYHFIDSDSGFKFVKLELVLAKKEYIRRDKDKNDIKLIRNYFFNHSFDKQLYNKVRYKKSILQKIKNRLRPYYKKLKDLEWTYCANSDMLIMQNTEKLLAYQYKDGKFNRYDIIVRYLAIEEYFGKNDFGFDLYKKMQEKRGYLQRIDHKVVDDSLKKFISLIKNIEKKGFDECSLIPVDKNQALIDGSHRVATALYFDIKLLPLKLNRKRFDTIYSLEWFEKKGFSQDEINLIEQKKKEIFYKKDIYFQIILWPPVQKYFGEIESSIKEKYNILDNYNISFKDKSSFKDFVFGIYESDDIDDWKIEKKLTGFNNFDLSIRVIEVEITNPRFRRKGLNNHDISQEVESIKKEYRTKYKDKVDDYFYDIIMHIGDNYHHTREIAKVIRKYR